MRKKNNHRNKRRVALKANYYYRHRQWLEREPAWWRIFEWIRWKSEKPKKPKWLQEEEELWTRRFYYGR